MRKILALSLAAMVFSGPVMAQELPPLSLFKIMMAPRGADSGWIGFRNFMGNQIVYFSTVLSYHCHIDEIRYSLNSNDLNERFLVPPCDPANPYADPEDYMAEDIGLLLPLGTVKSMHIQVLYDDGSESDIFEYAPCPDVVGENTCVLRIE